MSIFDKSIICAILSGVCAFDTASAASASQTVLDIGSRWEPFVDSFLVAQSEGVALKLQTPVKREIALVMDEPWEGISGAYVSAVQDDGKVLLYYRGSAQLRSDADPEQTTCVAFSKDGVNFEKPSLGIVEINGSTANNVILQGSVSHNFTVFLDTRPGVAAENRFKALGGVKKPGKGTNLEREGGLFAFVSADGVHWRKMSERPVITTGAFDSQNLAFWDSARNCYVCYSRTIVERKRAIQSCLSDDFMSWSAPQVNKYHGGVPLEHFYTSATLPCPAAPHIYLAFPMRFIEGRQKIATHKVKGVSDAVFMSSRDGVNWDRPFLEAWVRPGLDQQNWTDRNTMPAYGIVESAPGEWSMYVSEHYRHADNRLRRVTVRKLGFSSMRAGARKGEFTTKPLRFQGEELVLNYATSAAGVIRVEVQYATGTPIPGFGMDDAAELFGDELEGVTLWRNGGSLKRLEGQTVKLRFSMRDADLFAVRFR